MQIFAGVRWRARQMRVGIVENGDFRFMRSRFMRSLSYKHFTYMATRQLSGDTTVNDLGIFQGHWTVSHQISQKRYVIRQKLL